ncbi:MAG: hypothetical protein VCA18_03055, partial [Opitutales bacterium]
MRRFYFALIAPTSPIVHRRSATSAPVTVAMVATVATPGVAALYARSFVALAPAVVVGSPLGVVIATTHGLGEGDGLGDGLGEGE